MAEEPLDPVKEKVVEVLLSARAAVECLITNEVESIRVSPIEAVFIESIVVVIWDRSTPSWQPAAQSKTIIHAMGRVVVAGLDKGPPGRSRVRGELRTRIRTLAGRAEFAISNLVIMKF